MTCKAKSHNSLNKHTKANNQRGLAKQNHIIHNKQTNKQTNKLTNKQTQRTCKAKSKII